MGKKLPTFTPIFDFLAADFPKLNLTALAVLGVVWRYCQLDAGVCFASHKTIGAKVGIKSDNTVKAALRKLIAAGLIEDLGEKPRPGGGGNTHHYTLTDNFHEVSGNHLSKNDTPQQEQKPGKVSEIDTLSYQNLMGKVSISDTEETDKETKTKRKNNNGASPSSGISDSDLFPKTDSEQLLFVLFNANFTNGHKLQESFPNITLKAKFERAAARLGDNLQPAIEAALSKPGMPLEGVINYIAKFEPKAGESNSTNLADINPGLAEFLAG